MRFAQECQVTRKLNHPNIVRVLDFGLDGNKPFLVMEYVPGENLGERLERTGRLPEAEAVHLISQVGEALHWAHQHRLIHRDVKPDNILITPGEQAKLTDLGLVKNLEGDFNLTQTKSCMGTPNFMAPEQFEDAKRADAISDLYSLAATLYMTVTGELPFKARSANALGAVYKKKLVNDIAAPNKVVPELSARLSDAILKALKSDRRKRHRSVQEFITSLSDVQPAPAMAILPAPVEEIHKPSAENRRQKRFTSQRGTTCRPLQRAADKRWTGQVVNISQTGLCLELNRRFEPGAYLTIVVGSDQSGPRCLVGRVIWVKKHSKAAWQLGCQLDQPLCDFEVDELR
jgi:serine/threonine protein kinase